MKTFLLQLFTAAPDGSSVHVRHRLEQCRIQFNRMIGLGKSELRHGGVELQLQPLQQNRMVNVSLGPAPAQYAVPQDQLHAFGLALDPTVERVQCFEYLHRRASRPLALGHSSRAIFQRCSAATLVLSSSNSVMRGFSDGSDSARVSRRTISSDGLSHPVSSQLAISSGGSGGRVKTGRCTFSRNSPTPSLSLGWFSFADLVFDELALAAPRLIEGWLGKPLSHRLQGCSRICRLAGLRCWFSASR